MSYRIGEDVINVVEYEASGKETVNGGLKYAKNMVDAELAK